MSDRLQGVATGEGEPASRGFGKWISGRARRREYWLWAIPLIVAVLVVAAVAPGFEIVLGPVMLCVWIRRLHDLGWTGWIAPLINIGIAIVGWIEAGVLSAGGGGGLAQGLASLAALIALGAIPGERRANRFGAPPGGPDVAETFT